MHTQVWLKQFSNEHMNPDFLAKKIGSKIWKQNMKTWPFTYNQQDKVVQINSNKSCMNK